MRNIIKLTLLPVIVGAGIASFAATASADVNFRFGIDVGPPSYYYAPAPRPYYYNSPGGCYWDGYHGRVCTY